MEAVAEKVNIQSRIIKTEPVVWAEFKYIQQEDFKTWTPEAKQNLKNSIIQNQFAQPFYVWLDETTSDIYCLDGRHRTLILEELIQEGMEIPELLDATFIDCKDKKEAAKMVLVYSSMYAKISQQGLFDFMQIYQSSLDDFADTVDIPGFKMDEFVQRFDTSFSGHDEPEVGVPAESVIVKEGDLFEINGHRIICGDSTDEATMDQLLAGNKINTVFTSPPYNMNAGMYDEYKDNLKPDEFMSLHKAVVNNLMRHLSGYLFYNISYNRNSRSEFIDILHHLKHLPGINFLELIIWNKKTALPVVSDEMLTRQFEQVALISTDDMINDLEIYFAGANKRKVYFNKKLGKTMTNYWEIPVNLAKVHFENHHACFPVELPTRAINLTTKKGEIVTDPFLGMGTTILACEALGTLCYGIEMKPAYVQGSIIRYLNYCYNRGIEINFNHCNGTLSLSDFQKLS